ncbi:MAG: hypothetical protein ACT4O2_14725 [Beijerinckiaceae bacterium]
MAGQRITEDFVKHFKLLKERSWNSPHNVRRALQRDPQVATSIRELDRISSQISRFENYSKWRFIVQAHPEFSKAWRDYRERWYYAYITLADWEAEKDGRETPSAWFERRLSELSDNKESSFDADDEDDWDFYPEEHSAAGHVEEIFEQIGYKADDEPFYSRAKDAWDWLVNTVGVDLKKIEERWKEFPVLSIPEHVSNAHGLNEAKSLYSYLTDVRLAYMIGADLAAIAMCRAATEILIRYHYNNDPNTDLKTLVKATQNKREFAFLKPLNLVTKIVDANNILHFNEDIKNSDRNRAIVREWIAALQETIAKAPRP